MTNIYFPDQEITFNDLYFVCYMIERTARAIKQRNNYVVGKMGKDGLARQLSIAETTIVLILMRLLMPGRMNTDLSKAMWMLLRLMPVSQIRYHQKRRWVRFMHDLSVLSRKMMN